jgi:uncharacterized membrane protein (UPF0127 family)
MTPKPIRISPLLFLLFFLTACQPTDSSMSLGADGRVSGIISGQDLAVELAFTDAARQRGLMFRDTLEETHGMLFLFERADRLSFWMRNTRIPLDIGFFDSDGILREILPLYPFDETPVQSRSNRIQFALEVNRGWFARHGVQPGAQLDLDRVAATLIALGGDPSQFGLNR